MTDEPQPTVRVSPGSASLLAAAIAAVGAWSTAAASFLLGDPFRAGVGDLAAELKIARTAGVSTIRSVEEALATEGELDLDVVAEVAVETVSGSLGLTLRALEMARRADLGPWVATDVKRLHETVEAIAELLSGRAAGEGVPPAGEEAPPC